MLLNPEGIKPVASWSPVRCGSDWTTEASSQLLKMRVFRGCLVVVILAPKHILWLLTWIASVKQFLGVFLPSQGMFWCKKKKKKKKKNHKLYDCNYCTIWICINSNWVWTNYLINHKYWDRQAWPEAIKLFFMINSAEHEICPANKSQITSHCKIFFARHYWAWKFLY